MSPNEIDKIQDRLYKAFEKFGWKKKEVKVQHERDGDCSWKENIWLGNGFRLFSESDLEESLAEELIRISNENVGCISKTSN